jgi:membrane-bound inhibitor of C-type lysozyme
VRRALLASVVAAAARDLPDRDGERWCRHIDRVLLERRVAALEARSGLAAAHGPVRYVCDGDPPDEMVATYFGTDPPSALVERGERVAWLYGVPAASGAKYRGAGQVLWDHHGEAMILRADGAPEQHCVTAP